MKTDTDSLPAIKAIMAEILLEQAHITRAVINSPNTHAEHAAIVTGSLLNVAKAWQAVNMPYTAFGGATCDVETPV